MLTLFFATLVVISRIEARIFDNPVLNENYSEPGAIKIDGTYYVVTADINTTLRFSTDLVNWETSGYVFDDDGGGSGYGVPIRNPEIHKYGDLYRFYFWYSVPYIAVSEICLAEADNIFGPYKKKGGYLVRGLTDQTVFFDNATSTRLIIIPESHIFRAAPLNDEGQLAGGGGAILLESDLAWEHGILVNPSMFKRGDYFYLLYSGGLPCNNSRSIGVARATDPWGPYEKRGAPILVPNKVFTEPSFASLVRGLDDKSDILVFQANLKCDPCGKSSTLMASVGWGSDNWPYVFDY